MNNEEPFDHFLQKEEPQAHSTMVVILDVSSNQHMKILYTNESSTSFFSSSKHSPEQFFGLYWSAIREAIVEKAATLGSCQISIIGQEPLKMTMKELADSSKGFLLLLEFQNSVSRNANQLWKEKYQSLLFSNSDALLTLNGQGQITFCNPMIKKLLNYKPKQLIGKPFHQLVSEVDQLSFRQLWSYVKLGKTFELPHIELMHQKGHELLVSLKALPVVVKGEHLETQVILKELPNYLISNSKRYYLSYHDHLTGLWNRRMLKIHFAQDSLQAVNEKGKLRIIHLGIDRFKVVVESLGYMAGNQILRMVAERLRKICTAGEKVYRNSGDEFIFLVQEYSFAQTERICNEVLCSFKKPFLFNGQEYYLSISIGISTFPEHGNTIDELTEKSKQALSVTKQRGRAHFRYFEEDMKATFTNEALMESHLRRAIEFDELKVCFQPQVELETGTSTSFEALLRWNNRKFGEVSPADFIPLAEASGIIHVIGDWVIDQVCQHLKEWQKKQYKPVKVAINISPSQFRSENFCVKLFDTVRKYELQTNCIEIEITESALMRPDETLKSLRQLKEMGFTISVDDFGTGYSSLSYLKKYPIDIIKIDRSFIQDIEMDAKNEAIAKTIINLAHSLGMNVIAEGIETVSQAEILKESKCRIAQGFLYSKAVPSEVIERDYLEIHQ
ncbi:sensor domain-containing protein [Sporosarcina aquimarina]|uniref:sensor domain-containing protein n=1 Tax=Sporosarcina aquimarina TaxID=114975 RepID=UPI001C8DD864|nr:GGDEF domain-containing phosphodiesterase [Sporosarcina aquimarina]MBY0222979.1 EAL domain-containing protein [Sporosarcina aquimarina]